VADLITLAPALDRAPARATWNRLAELHAQHAPALLRYATRLTGSEADAEDLVQEAFLQLARRCDRAVPDNAAAYLTRTVRNLWLNELRRRRRALLDVDGDLDDAGAGEHHDVPTSLELRQRTRALLRAVAELPERQRRALVLEALEGREREEIGTALGLNANALAQLLHRARRGVALAG
jgi:RNA polymerase sigma-70 factor (ECF subfamily)